MCDQGHFSFYHSWRQFVSDKSSKTELFCCTWEPPATLFGCRFPLKETVLSYFNTSQCIMVYLQISSEPAVISITGMDSAVIILFISHFPWTYFQSFQWWNSESLSRAHLELLHSNKNLKNVIEMSFYSTPECMNGYQATSNVPNTWWRECVPSFPPPDQFQSLQDQRDAHPPLGSLSSRGTAEKTFFMVEQLLHLIKSQPCS